MQGYAADLLDRVDESAERLSDLLDRHPGRHLLAEYEATVLERHDFCPLRASDLLARMESVIVSLTAQRASETEKTLPGHSNPARPPRGPAEGYPRRRLKGTGQALRSVSAAARDRQGEGGGHRCDRPRWLASCGRSHSKCSSHRRPELPPSPSGRPGPGTGHAAGSPRASLEPTSVDARPLVRGSPETKPRSCG